jgi:phage tail-like protein
MGKARQLPDDLRIRLTVAARQLAVLCRECSGIESETQVIEHREGGDPSNTTRKIAGATTWSNITLKRGLDASRDLWAWRDAVLGQGINKVRADGTIELLNSAGKAVATFNFKQGWPVRYAVTSVSGAAGATIEEIELTVERVERA